MHDGIGAVEDIPALEAKLIMKISAKKGRHAGNVTLQRELGWNPDRYWPIRDRLVDSGELKRGKGRGGSVTLVLTAKANGHGQPRTAETQPEAGALELCGPVADVLQNEWARNMQFRNHITEITSRVGRRDTRATEMLPDIVVAALRVFPHVPGKFFDLIAFEVKPLRGLDVTAVFEGLSHRRAAHQAYVWLHVPREAAGEGDILAALERVGDEARRHGVGLIVGETPANYETWKIQIKAARVEPDPEILNDFIGLQLSAAARDELARWFR